MEYLGYVAAWVVSGGLHMVAGGYVCYRFRAQIDAVRARVEPVVVKVLGTIWK